MSEKTNKNVIKKAFKDTFRDYKFVLVLLAGGFIVVSISSIVSACVSYLLINFLGEKITSMLAFSIALVIIGFGFSFVLNIVYELSGK